jgi:hypothetical protein
MLALDLLFRAKTAEDDAISFIPTYRYSDAAIKTT